MTSEISEQLKVILTAIFVSAVVVLVFYGIENAVIFVFSAFIGLVIISPFLK